VGVRGGGEDGWGWGFECLPRWTEGRRAGRQECKLGKGQGNGGNGRGEREEGRGPHAAVASVESVMGRREGRGEWSDD